MSFVSEFSFGAVINLPLLTVVFKLLHLGFEAQTPLDTWFAFGPVQPGARARLMGGADVIVAGYQSHGGSAAPEPFATDAFISSYAECSVSDDGVVDGVCECETVNHSSYSVCSAVCQLISVTQYSYPVCTPNGAACT